MHHMQNDKFTPTSSAGGFLTPLSHHASGKGRSAKQQQRGGQRQPKTGKRPGSDAGATTLRNRKTEGGGKTGQRRKAKQPPAGENEAKARVEARKGDTKHRKDHMPRKDDAAFGYTGRTQISWNVLATIGALMH